MAKGNSQKPANGSALDFEAQLWADWSRSDGVRQDVLKVRPIPDSGNVNEIIGKFVSAKQFSATPTTNSNRCCVGST